MQILSPKFYRLFVKNNHFVSTVKILHIRNIMEKQCDEYNKFINSQIQRESCAHTAGLYFLIFVFCHINNEIVLTVRQINLSLQKYWYLILFLN